MAEKVNPLYYDVMPKTDDADPTAFAATVWVNDVFLNTSYGK